MWGQDQIKYLFKAFGAVAFLVIELKVGASDLRRHLNVISLARHCRMRWSGVSLAFILVLSIYHSLSPVLFTKEYVSNRTGPILVELGNNSFPTF